MGLFNFLGKNKIPNNETVNAVLSYKEKLIPMLPSLSKKVNRTVRVQLYYSQESIEEFQNGSVQNLLNMLLGFALANDGKSFELFVNLMHFTVSLQNIHEFVETCILNNGLIEPLTDDVSVLFSGIQYTARDSGALYLFVFSWLDMPVSQIDSFCSALKAMSLFPQYVHCIGLGSKFFRGFDFVNPEQLFAPSYSFVNVQNLQDYDLTYFLTRIVDWYNHDRIQTVLKLK